MIDKIPYFFRQDTDFRYLTGCLEQDCVLAVAVDASGAADSIMFFRDKSEKEEMWEGPRTRPSPATTEYFGLDAAHHKHKLESYLCDYQRRTGGEFVLWYDFAMGGITHPMTHAVMQGRDSPIFLQFFYLFSIFFLNRF
jgi:Xaa-Pro aminopeptidase